MNKMEILQFLINRLKGIKKVKKFRKSKHPYKKFSNSMLEMQETYFSNEKQAIRADNNGRRSYGTNSKLRRTSEVLIRHELSKSDTLQGLALKYGCSMEQIRRANRLFANDSLFLREFLMVPVEKDSPYYPKDAERPHSLPRANTIAGTSDPKYKDKDSPDKSVGSALTSPEEEQRAELEEFLGKIDSAIASSKKEVSKYVKNNANNDIISSQSDDNIYGNSFINHNYDQAHSSTSSYQQYFQQPVNFHQYARNSLGASSNNCPSPITSDTTQLIVMTKGKRIRNQINRLEKQQDEMFEL